MKAQPELYKENSLVALSQEVLETVYNGPRNRSGNSELMNLKESNVILNTLWVISRKPTTSPGQGLQIKKNMTLNK